MFKKIEPSMETTMLTKFEGLSDKEIIIEQQKIIGELLNIIQSLENKVKELESKLNKNSNNSSKPPSTDGLKKKPTNNRKASDKKTGGQEGHEGVTLLKSENPDEVIDIPNIEVCNCGCNLSNVEGIRKTRQIHDIIPARLYVTEYGTDEKTCPDCGKIHKSEFPSNVTQPVEYGNSLKTLVTYLNEYQLLPLDRTVEAIEDMIGIKISQGTVVNMNEKLFHKVEEPVKNIKEQIIASEVVHFDETGVRNEGKTQWLHSASTKELTYYEINPKRGKEAMDTIAILPNFHGAAVHDHLKSYYSYTECSHGECNSHNLRYLRDIYENYGQNWAKTMSELLIEIKKRVELLKTEGFKEVNLSESIEWSEKYHNVIIIGMVKDYEKNKATYENVEGKKKPKKSKALQLLLKLQKYDIETLAFMYDFNIPFDNNLAERDIRMQKLRQKISGCFRGKDGAKVFCRIRSYLSTARKNGVKAMDAIKRAFCGNPYLPTNPLQNGT
jgi:transposase